MFSFDVSAIDIVLVVAVIVLLFLYPAHKKTQASTTERSHTPIIEKPYVPIVEKSSAPIIEEPHVEEEKPLQEEHKVDFSTIKSEDIAPKSSEIPLKCVHTFGYLGNRSKNTLIPDECLGCPKVMRCISQKG